MSFGGNYNPQPTRVWSRVQGVCPDTTEFSDIVYFPFTNKFLPKADADYQYQLFYKGNILQYKKNSANFTKQEKYSRLAKSNRNISATQTQTYTNPNTKSLLRVGSIKYPYPNNLVNEPNNPAGPFVSNPPNPFDCSSNVIEVGGTLICGTYVEPCSNTIIRTRPATNGSVCFPTYCSDVPGPIQELCWNNRLTTFFPRQRYIMPNSLNKWPVGYKGFISAVKPYTPLLTSSNITTDSVLLSWTVRESNCLPLSSFVINQRKSGTSEFIPIANLPSNIFTFKVNGLISGTIYEFKMFSLSNTIKSDDSDIIVVMTD
jgi:hypothetical protein